MSGEILGIFGVGVALAGLMLTNSRGLRQDRANFKRPGSGLQRMEARVAGRPGRREIDFGCPFEVFVKTLLYVLLVDQHRVAPAPNVGAIALRTLPPELESLDLYPLSLICQGSISVQFGLGVS